MPQPRTPQCRSVLRLGTVLVLLLGMFCAGHVARAEEPVDPKLRDIGLDDNRGQQIPLDVELTNENGEKVKLAQYFHQGKPVVIVPVYYSCPSLCGYTLKNVDMVMQEMKWAPGKEFTVLTISFDPTETVAMAQSKREMYLKDLNRPGAEKGWHFFVGSKEETKRLMKALGFRYKYDVADQQYLHSPATYVLTADGEISEYFGSITFEAKDMRLALVKASDGEIGNLVDKVILFCCTYDPQTGKYSMIAFRVMQLGGTVTMLILGGGIGAMLLLERRRKKRRAEAVARTAGQNDEGHAPA